MRKVDVGLLILRLIAGFIFLAHGYQKFFVFGIDGATGAFTQMGVPWPAITAPLTAAVEVLAGLAVIFGLLTRVAALGLAIDMLGAIALVKAKGGFYSPNGMEFELMLSGAALALVFTGAGEYSLDAIWTKRRKDRVAT